MTMNSNRREQIVKSLRDKEYRDLFVSEQIDTGVAFQIRALRKDRGWSQSELAERVGMTQEGVSRLENPDYGKFTYKTLKRLASAFDVALVARFEPFSRLVDWVVNLSPEDLTVPDFERDLGLVRDIERTTARTMPAMREDIVGRDVGPITGIHSQRQPNLLTAFMPEFPTRTASTAEESRSYVVANTQLSRGA